MKTTSQKTPDEKEDKKNSKEIVRVEHLKKAFDNKVVLKDVNFTIDKGESLVVMGGSGTGKSVLIKCMVRLTDADGGKVMMLGEDILELKDKKLNEMRKRLGFLFQGAALYDSMTLRENLEFPLRDSKMERKEIDERVKEMLENVGLVDSIEKKPAELSGGMKKRAGLARTLILQPEIIFYDEPTTGLDPITSREMSELILKMQKKFKTTSIIITHDIECAQMTSDRVMLLNEGTFVAEGTFEELRTKGEKWVKSFLNHEHN